MSDYSAYPMKTVESVTVMDDGKTLLLNFESEVGGALSLALPQTGASGLLAALISALGKAQSRAGVMDVVSFYTPIDIKVSKSPEYSGATFISFNIQGADLNMRIDNQAIEDLILRLQTSLSDARSTAGSTH